MQDAVLLGREREIRTIRDLLTSVRSGVSGSLVLRGEAGIGKSALLAFAAREAVGFQVVRFSGTESEAELAFGGLHQLCTLLPIGFEELPSPQRRALSTAFGMESGDPPDSFLVGLATLSLLSAAAEQRPSLYLVDDTQWLDQASRQVLAFVARRLEVDAIGLFFATREPSVDLAGIPEICVDGLSPDQSRKLLETVLPGATAQPVRDEILEVSHGNPLAILEIPRGLSAVELAGDFTFGGLSGELHPAERSFTQRLAKLPADTQILLLVTAAEPQGRREVVWRAATLLGVGPNAIVAAEQAGLAHNGGPGEGIKFRHPLVRSAVYRSATFGQRRKVHLALAEASNSEADADRRAWHRALAAIGPDEALAAELERSAAQAEGRGGLTATVALLRRAVALTPDPLRRSVRALRAAEAAKETGEPDLARQFLEVASNARLPGLQRARKQRLEAQLAYIAEPGRPSVSALIDAAASLLPFDVGLARQTYVEALSAAIIHTSSDGIDGWIEIAKALKALLDHTRPLQVADLLLDAVTTTMIEGSEKSAPILKRAVQAYMSDDISAEDSLRWWQLGWLASAELWDPDRLIEVIGRTVQQARERGALDILPGALFDIAICYALVGELDSADAACQEGAGIMASLGQDMVPFPAPVLAAHRGVEFPGTADGVHGELAKNYAALLLANGHAHYKDGLEAAHRAFHHEILNGSRVFPELIETATRCGDEELACAALGVLRSRAAPSGTNFALGLVARCEALLTPGPEAESLYEEAISRLEQTRSRIQMARAHLLLGEWLRRAHRPNDARGHLRQARDMLSEMGANAFAERAQRELMATGDRSRTVSSAHLQLTPREEQIAMLAAQRRTNVEIAAQLFVSPRTVDYHLRKVFQKLNIDSRRQLRASLTRADP